MLKHGRPLYFAVGIYFLNAVASLKLVTPEGRQLTVSPYFFLKKKTDDLLVIAVCKVMTF